MTHNDLTILFLTVNKVPRPWAEFQKETLLEEAEILEQELKAVKSRLAELKGQGNKN